MRSLLIVEVLAIAATAHAQFTLQTSNTTADLRGIHNVGGGVAWASGTNGTVIRTEDGGYVWQGCSMPPGAEKLDFRGIQAFDANTAIVMSSGKGDLSRLYKTTDGCHSWKLVFTNPDKDGFWDSLYFDRSRWGWLLGDPVKGMFALFSTDDAGKTWVRQSNEGLKADSSTQGAFAASNSSLIGQYVAAKFGSGGTGGANFYASWEARFMCTDCSGEEMRAYRTGKKSMWIRQPIPVGINSESSGVFSIAQKQLLPAHDENNSILIAVGGDYAKPDDRTGTAAFTIDGGKTWQPAQTSPHGYRSAVAYDGSAKTWVTVGPNGTDISTDDGRNWRAVHPDPAIHEASDADRNWNALSPPYVVGPHGRIGRLDEAALTANKGDGK